MPHPQAWLCLSAVVLGNCGFWLFCFNRVNAAGLPRKWTKKFEKLVVSVCFLLPLLLVAVEGPGLWHWLTDDSQRWWPSDAPWFHGYGAWCVASTLVLGPLWLESRRLLWPPSNLIHTDTQQHDIHTAIEGGSPGTALTHFLRSLPGNQISHLQVTRKALRLPRAIAGLEGFRIGHLSDLHFTGQFRLEHYHFVLDRFLELEPDLIVITGDIIDYDRCLPWIESLLGRLRAPHGCYFVLGNHDRRLTNVDALLSSLTSLGHHDLGHVSREIEISVGTKIELIGNELPWFERHAVPPRFASTAGHPNNTLRLALSHSPDQFEWARDRRADLLLAGHTHGGQIRFPGIGPIVAPSWNGSRHASGVFYSSPTLMHVSRGVAGTHPLRWWCCPEVSLLTLCNPMP